MLVEKKYRIDISASPEKVWYILWDLYYYKKWTSVFSSDSYAKTDNWKEGSIVHFLNSDGNGMYSKVILNKQFEKMHFTHLGEIKNYDEQEINDGPESWSGARENYTLTEKDAVTTLLVEIDFQEGFSEYFDNTFPKALEIVKNLAEDFFITVETTVNRSLEKVWSTWNNPKDIERWYTASDDWHTPKAENHLVVGGNFSYRMEAKDGSVGFDFTGEYTSVINQKSIEIVLADERIVRLLFEVNDNKVRITEQFEPENHNSYDLQRFGWQSILNNFKQYVESK